MRCAALACLAATACSSHYIPHSPGRVAVSMLDGKPVYIRDGRIYEHGVLGGGLQDAVAGNRAAEVAAGEYHDHMRDGLIEVFGGMGLMLGGSVWAAADAISQQDQQRKTVPIIPLALALAGCAIMIYGGADLAGAEPYRWDAINLFNDGAVETPRLGPPGSVAKASLHMRD